MTWTHRRKLPIFLAVTTLLPIGVLSWLAVRILQQDRDVERRDGSLRILKSVDWKGPTKIFFSPDSQSIAYDLAGTENSNERHVYIMALDGSRETAAVVHSSQNVIMGWSPDGRHLLFASDRSGSYGLGGLPVAGGKSVGTATACRSGPLTEGVRITNANP